MIEVRFYDEIEDSLLKFAVIISKTNGKWVFCKHKARDTVEVPGGHRESGETIEETARRELREETGYCAEKITFLGKCYPTPGYCSEIIHIYLAEKLKWVGQELDPGEFVEVVKMPLCKLCDMVMNNEISDAKTVIAALKAEKILNKSR